MRHPPFRPPLPSSRIILVPHRHTGRGRAAGVLAAALLAAALPALLGAQSLRGSRASVHRMRGYAVQHKLRFHQTAATVRRAARRGSLVRIPQGRNLQLHDVQFPYVQPATRTFVTRLAAQYRAACGERLVVTSAVRPATMQPPNGSAESVHPTGMAVDLRRPAGECLAWLRRTLLSLEGAGVLEATEEHNPPHFHVAIFARPYKSLLAARADAASERESTRRNGQ